MHKFNIGDKVIVDGTNCSDDKWPHYLTGSIGIVRHVGRDGAFYEVDFETVVDARPDSRARHSYDLDFLVKNATFRSDSLEPYEVQDEPDPEFDLIFDMT